MAALEENADNVRYRHYVLGGAASLALAFGVAWLSAHPAWQSIPPDSGALRVSFTHSGARTCRNRTAEELAKLPPNMRASQVCERRREPVWLELEIDDAVVRAQNYPPSGFFGSGPSRIYERRILREGPHRIALRMRDAPLSAGYTHESSFAITLKAGENVAIDFDGTTNGFYVHGEGGP